MPSCSIVLPCYNEAAGLPALIAGFAEVASLHTDLEVIFVDNGSRDDSATVFAAELARPGRGFARLVTVPENLGYGHGIMSGLRAARGEYIGWTHADSQYEPRIVAEGFARLRHAAQPDLSILRGRRVGRPLFDAVFTAGMSLCASAALGTKVRDVNAQPKLFPRRLLSLMPDPPRDFSLDLYALFVARQHKFTELDMPVVFGRRLTGEAKGGGSLKLKWKLTKRTWSFILQLRRRVRAERESGISSTSTGKP